MTRPIGEVVERKAKVLDLAHWSSAAGSNSGAFGSPVAAAALFASCVIKALLNSMYLLLLANKYAQNTRVRMSS